MVSWCSLVEIREHLLFAFGPRCLISPLPVVTELCKCTLFSFDPCLALVRPRYGTRKASFSFFLFLKFKVSAGLPCFVSSDPWPLSAAQFQSLTGEMDKNQQECHHLNFYFFLSPPLWHIEAFHNNCKFHLVKKNSLYCRRKFTQSISGNGVRMAGNPPRVRWCGYHRKLCSGRDCLMIHEEILSSCWLPKLIAKVVVLKTS